MKIYILIILSFIFINKHSKGQVSQDTIYFNKDWDKVCHNNAKYYRIIEKLNTHFIVRDYYINEQLQMVGSYISINPEIKDGEFTWYKKNGKVLSVGHYINNMANGSFMSFRKNGNIFLKETYINDTLNGILTYWKRDGTFDFAVEYCKGKHDTSYASFKYIYFYSIAFIDSIFKMYSKNYVEENIYVDCLNTRKNENPKIAVFFNRENNRYYEIELYKNLILKYKYTRYGFHEHYEFYRRNGYLNSDKLYTNKEKDGVVKNYYRNGEIKTEMRLVKDEIVFPYYIWKKNRVKYKIDYISLETYKEFGKFNFIGFATKKVKTKMN